MPDVRRIDPGANHALSRSTRVVRSVTSVLAPPITPASPMARRGSAIISIVGSSARSWPSRVVKRSSARARRLRLARR